MEQGAFLVMGYFKQKKDMCKNHLTLHRKESCLYEYLFSTQCAYLNDWKLICKKYFRNSFPPEAEKIS